MMKYDKEKLNLQSWSSCKFNMNNLDDNVTNLDLSNNVP